MVEVSFGEWVKRRRKALGLTQEQLAHQISCSTSALRKIESEERRPSLQVVEQLANAFHLPSDQRASFLKFARGDWQAAPIEGIEQIPEHTSSEKGESSNSRIHLATFPSTFTHHNLPVQLTSFVGREKELADIMKLMESARMVTLIGPGGTGKTRLSIQAASELLDQYPDGIWFVELAPIFDPQLVPRTTAMIIGLRSESQRPIIEILCDYLRDKKMLLVLDNCEHLVDACARLADQILHAAPKTSILASSREALGIGGEVTYRVPSLGLPDPSHLPPVESLSQYEAVKLFIDRATSAVPTFTVTNDNAPALAQACHHLDGIPLAIELAAAKIRVLSVEQIAKRLDDRFKLLTGGNRTALERHQTLRAAIDWSYNLLTSAEQVLFQRSSVFVGGWTLEAAESVCEGGSIQSEDVLDLVEQLIHKSLVLMEEEQGEARYHMLETIRQYAHEKLLETEGSQTIRDKHLAYFVNLVEQAEPELYRSNQVFWFKKLDDELDNLRLALEWALATDIASGLRITSSPWRFWQRRNYQESGDWISQLLERYPQSDSLRAQALAVYSIYVFMSGNEAEARRIAEQGLQLARDVSDQQNEALNLLFLGRIIAFPGHYHEGTLFLEHSLGLYRILGDKIGQATATAWLSINHNDLEHSKSLVLESLKLQRDLGNLSGIAWCLTFLAYYTIFGEDFSSPADWLEEAITIYRELGDQLNEADALETLGILAFWQGDYQQACSYYEQAITLYDKVGGSWSFTTRLRMAYVFLRQNDIVQARETFEVSLQYFQNDGRLIGLIYSIEGLASLHMIQGQPARAARLFAWADVMREQIGDHRPPVEQNSVERDLAVIHSKMDDAEFTKLSEEGRAMTVEQAIALALETVEET